MSTKKSPAKIRYIRVNLTSTYDASWRIAISEKGIWVENIFPLEYTKWSRFTHWGKFESVELAEIACRLCELGDESETAHAALTTLVSRNKGFENV